MDVREKLVELLKEAKKEYEHISNFNAGITNPEEFVIELIANHLIAHGVTVQEWISVNDRLPGMNEEVFAIYKNSLFENGPKFTKVLHRESKHWVDGNGYRYLYENITHWLPLPQPPKGE